MLLRSSRRGTIVGGLLVLVVACGGTGESDSASGDGGDRVASRGSVTLPPVAARFDYQLGGAHAPPPGVRVVVRDRTAAPASGSYGICYVNAFQTQPDETGWWKEHHDDLLLHRSAKMYVTDPDWPDEVLLDTSTPRRRAAIAAIVGGWIDACGRAGYRGVEPDNLDSWERSQGRLTRADNLALAKLLAARAHARGLAIAQKNAAEVAEQGRDSVGFDFAVVEGCQVYDECETYIDVYAGRVLDIEYTDTGRGTFRAACAAHRGDISIILRDRDLVPRGDPSYVYAAC